MTICGPFHLHGLTLFSAWISDYIHYKMPNESTYPFTDLNGRAVEFWKYISIFITYIAGHVWWLHYLDAIPSKRELRATTKQVPSAHKMASEPGYGLRKPFRMQLNEYPTLKEQTEFRLDFSNRSEIWQAPRQQRCRDASQISEWYDQNNNQFRSFETSRGLGVRRLTV